MQQEKQQQQERLLSNWSDSPVHFSETYSSSQVRSGTLKLVVNLLVFGCLADLVIKRVAWCGRNFL